MCYFCRNTPTNVFKCGISNNIAISLHSTLMFYGFTYFIPIRIKIKSVQSDVRGGRISETCAGIVLHQTRFAQLSRL